MSYVPKFNYGPHKLEKSDTNDLVEELYKGGPGSGKRGHKTSRNDVRGWVGSRPIIQPKKVNDFKHGQIGKYDLSQFDTKNLKEFADRHTSRHKQLEEDHKKQGIHSRADTKRFRDVMLQDIDAIRGELSARHLKKSSTDSLSESQIELINKMYDDLMLKGGPGSGIRGHKTTRDNREGPRMPREMSQALKEAHDKMSDKEKTKNFGTSKTERDEYNRSSYGDFKIQETKLKNGQKAYRVFDWADRPYVKHFSSEKQAKNFIDKENKK